MQVSKSINSLDALQCFAKQLSALIVKGTVVYLHGDLGAGKTALTRSLIQAWEREQVVTSPTYNIMKQYVLSNIQVLHIDLYRLNDPEELDYLGLRDYCQDEYVIFIEWPERAPYGLPQADIDCFISTQEGSTARQLIMISDTDRGRAVLKEVSGSD